VLDARRGSRRLCVHFYFYICPASPQWTTYVFLSSPIISAQINPTATNSCHRVVRNGFETRDRVWLKRLWAPKDILCTWKRVATLSQKRDMSWLTSFLCFNIKINCLNLYGHVCPQAFKPQLVWSICAKYLINLTCTFSRHFVRPSSYPSCIIPGGPIRPHLLLLSWSLSHGTKDFWNFWQPKITNQIYCQTWKLAVSWWICQTILQNCRTISHFALHKGYMLFASSDFSWTMLTTLPNNNVASSLMESSAILHWSLS
jgi:hypothetical protein